MASLYPWLLALHIIAFTAWMAANLYLPRLFVYHAETPAGSPQSETFKVMERRLYRGIMTPAMIATWVLGISLALTIGAFSEPWLHAKLLFVLLLSGFHGFCGAAVRRFANDRNTRPAKFYRAINEVPFVFFIVIVFLVVLKPF